jgi:CheY-like chemotaxis protein/HPt (histidine-containing phosphotransfer) domain-containing protein
MQTNERKLLLIDDDPISLEVLSVLLSASGFLVTTAAGSAEALALIRNQQQCFDLILTDVQMPDMSSSELISALRAETSAPLIAMSSSYPGEAALAGSSGFLLKPFEVDSLLTLVDQLPTPQIRPAQGSSTLLILDRDKLLRAMPMEAAQRVYRAFLDDLPIRLSSMDAILQADPVSSVDLAKQAHILRGSSAMIGAEQLAAACATVEEAGKMALTRVVKRGDLIKMLGGIRNTAAELEGMLKDELARTTEKQE